MSGQWRVDLWTGYYDEMIDICFSLESIFTLDGAQLNGSRLQYCICITSIRLSMSYQTMSFKRSSATAVTLALGAPVVPVPLLGKAISIPW